MKTAFICSLLIYSLSALAKENLYIPFDRSPVKNVPYIAITSSEVQKIIGMYQSKNNEKEALKIILKRASDVCTSKGYELLDFEIKSESSKKKICFG